MFSLLTKGGLSARFKAVTGIEIAISSVDEAGVPSVADEALATENDG